MYALPALERNLVLYISAENFSKPFDISAIPVVTKEESDAQNLRQLTDLTPAPSSKTETKAPQTAISTEHASQKYAATLSQIPGFKEFGEILKSSLHPVELTEKETEYAVVAVKHIFKDHVVLQVLLSLTEVDSSLMWPTLCLIPYSKMCPCCRPLKRKNVD